MAKKKAIKVYVTDEDYEYYQKMAEQLKMSMSEMCSTALVDYLQFRPALENHNENKL